MWFGGLGSRQSMGLQGLSLCTGDISTAGAFPLEFVSGVEGMWPALVTQVTTSDEVPWLLLNIGPAQARCQ